MKPTLTPISGCALLSLSLSALSGCADCERYKCDIPAVEICAIDLATGEALRDFTVERIAADDESEMDSTEFTDGSASNCRALHTNAKQVRTILRAEGYEAVTLDVETDKDDCGNTLTERRDVALSQSPSQAPVIERKALEGC